MDRAENEGQRTETGLWTGVRNLGASTEKKFVRALTGDDISAGFVNRFLLFNVGRGCLERVEPKYNWLKSPTWLAEALKERAGPSPPNTEPIRIETLPVDGTVLVMSDFRRMGWGVRASPRYG